MKGKRFKKVTALLSTAAMLLTYADFSAIDFSVKAGENGDEPMLSNYDLNGDGDYDDVGECGWGYELDSADDLYWFADRVLNNGERRLNAFLTKDITINSDVLINGELNTDGVFKEWTPVGKNDSNSFLGTFEGGGHTISGLYINSPEENAGNRVGLFGYNNGTIKNVCIADSYIYGYSNVGSICGINNSNGTIENCCNSGVVKSIKKICGGICGRNTSTITNCFNTGEVEGLDDVGGICGHFNYEGIIKSCFNTGKVSGNSNIGGVCGKNDDNSTIKNCYNTGTVTGATKVGGISGEYTRFVSVDPILIENCYNIGMVSGDTSVGSICGVDDENVITNCYYLKTEGLNVNLTGKGNGDDVSGLIEAKSAGQFASGEVCWLLNSGETQAETPAFYQTIGEDEIPVFDSTRNTVYKNKACDGVSDYYNHENKDQEHSYENGFCTICDGYQPATTVKDVYDIDGDGETSDDVYEISNAGQLYWFADKVNNDNEHYGNANAVLKNDITVNSGVLDEDGELNEAEKENFREWTPIVAYNEIKEEYYYYSGTFDGNNKTISGLYFNNDSQRYVGLFGYVGTGGKIQDVTIADSYMYGKTKVGGICGNNNGTISNCYNTGDVTGTENYVGGVCGNNTGTILICYNTGDVTGTEKYVGGVCGSITGGSISNCYNTGDVTGTGNEVGGVCGRNTGGSISNCYNTGDVTGTGNEVGGVCGNNLQSEISNCYNTGDVTGTGNYVGGVCGRNTGSSISNCYYLDTIAENGIGDVDDETGSAEAKSAEQFASGEVCWLLNGGETQAETPAFYQTIGTDERPVLDSTRNTVYKNKACDGVSDYYNHENKDQEHNFDENGFCTICDGYQPATTVKDVNDIDGDGETSDDVYEISNAGQLYWFAGLVNGTLGGVGRIRSANAVLTNDITVNSGVLNENGELNEGDFRVWTPIGYYDYVNKKSYSYYGAFDGAGHTISGLYFNDSSANNVGLFGFVSNGASENKIMNLTVSDSYFCGDEKVGGVCGYSYYVPIQNCSNTGKVTGDEYVGGVCGYISKRVIENCYNTGKVSGNSYIGGICGYNCEKNTIQNCYNTGAVSGDTIVGGICGKVNYTSLTSNAYKMVTNCYNTGKVTGNTYVGSINGSGESKLIENCYYLGTEGVQGRGGGPDYAGSTEVKSAEQFASGEVCYLLNGGETQAETPVFFQNLEDKKDDLPVLDSKHGRVYLTTNCVTYSNTSGNKNHSLVSDKKDATCTEDGHSEYRYCKDCGKYFSDADCENEITDIDAWMTGDGKIIASGHSYKDGICENCGAFEDGIGARLAGVSLSLDGSIGVNFYMELSENVIADENAYLLVTYPNGSDDKMAVSDVKPINMNGRKYYIFQCKVAATEMTDTITAQMMTSNGDGTKYSYSVKEYADYLLAHTADNAEYAKAEQLVRTMLIYGTCAQTFKEYNTNNLPCEPMDIKDYKIKEHGFTAASSDNVAFNGANLSMLSNTTLRLFFEIGDTTGVTITSGSENLAIGENNGLYYVEIKNIAPQYLDNDFTVEVNDNGKIFNVTYSPMTYCYQVSQTSNDAALVNLVKAIALYNEAAKLYFMGGTIQ